MKNQYFGDIHDYKKYGLLRAFAAASSLNMLVAWMLTPNDGRPDGNFRDYLNQEQYRAHDPALYDWLQNHFANDRPRSVAAIESSGLLPNTQYFANPVSDDLMERTGWHSELMDASQGQDLVFLDPDNGLLPNSCQPGRRNSSKYLFWSEVAELWKAGKSLLIYQHFPRKNRRQFIATCRNNLQQQANNSYIEAFRTSHVVFLLVLQPRHGFLQRVDLAPWEGQIVRF